MKIGNRHRSHIQELAPILAETFQHFVIGCDPDYVKKNRDYEGEDPINKMLDTFKQNLVLQGVSEKLIQCVPDKEDAIKSCLDSAKPGDFLVLLADPWLANEMIKKNFSAL